MGHPDKVADQISDAVLDHCLAADPQSRVACETLTCTGLVIIAGEISTKAYVDFQTLVRGVVQSIGYDNALYGFDANTCAVISSINKQSGDIAMGVDTGVAGRSQDVTPWPDAVSFFSFILEGYVFYHGPGSWMA